MKPYIPNELPLENLDYKSLISLCSKANAELARYDGLLQGIPNPAVMLSPLTTQEAVLSSKIEGTQATVDEVMEQEAGMIKTGEKYQDIQEIINYRNALFKSKEHLQNYPISLGFVQEIHKILLDSVRGKNKTPGYFRTDQNWIGASGCPIEEATFIPPSPFILKEFLDKWIAYIGNDDVDFILQAAVVHAQFELLHPFKDGNGRIGRILITLFLYQKKVLSAPMFYLSSYLEENREEYYSCLQTISQKGNWNRWIIFFLRAVEQQAKDNSEKVKSIMKLYDATKLKIQDVTHSQYTVFLLDALFNKPIFKSTDLVKQLKNNCNIHEKTAMSLIKQLKDENILREKEPSSGRKPATLWFPDLLKVT